MVVFTVTMIADGLMTSLDILGEEGMLVLFVAEARAAHIRAELIFVCTEIR